MKIQNAFQIILKIINRLSDLHKTFRHPVYMYKNEKYNTKSLQIVMNKNLFATQHMLHWITTFFVHKLQNIYQVNI